MTSICLTVVILMAISLIFTNEAFAQNNAPIINSEPTLVVTTDQTYSYTINSTDIDNDNINYSLTTHPNGMTIKDNVITWSPITTGVYNVVIQADDGNKGYDSQSWQINVTAGDVRNIVVTPNDQPTIMTTDQKYQFTAKAYDNYGNLIEGTKFSWTSDSEFVTSDNNGMVTAVKPGIGYVKASIGDIQSAPGIVVKSPAPLDEVVASTDTNNTKENKKVDENNKDLNKDSELFTPIEDEENVAENNNEEKKCEENINHSLTFVLLIIYTIILFIYFSYEKKHKSTSWWIFPLLISFIGLIVYYRYFCPQTYLWWPWVMVIIGVIVTGYYKGRTDNEDDISKNELPF